MIDLFKIDISDFPFDLEINILNQIEWDLNCRWRIWIINTIKINRVRRGGILQADWISSISKIDEIWINNLMHWIIDGQTANSWLLAF